MLTVTVTNIEKGVKCYYISYTYSDGFTVAKPSISGTTPFLNSTTVTITAAEGAEIRYTTNGVDPTNNGNASYWVPYEGPFTITETTTVKAVAVLNNQTSDVATKTFTKTPSVASIEEFIALGNGKTGVFANPVTVIGQTSDKKYTYVQDGSAHGLLIYTSAGIDQAYEFGDVIPAGFTGTYSAYNGLHELTNPDNLQASEENAVPTPLELTPVQVTADNVGRYAVIKNATVNDGKIVVGTESVAIFNNRFNTAIPSDNNTYDIYGITSIFSNNNGTTLQFMPLEFKAVETPSDFAVEISPAAGTYQGSVTVTITPKNAFEGEVTIRYTLDESDPTSSNTAINTAIQSNESVTFTLTESATVKVWAVDDDDNEATAEAVYVIEAIPTVASIAEFIGKDGTQVFTNPVTVLGQKDNYLYVQDGSDAGMLVYGSVGQQYSFGDIIPAGFSGKYSLFRGMHEMTSPTDFDAASGNQAPTAIEVTVDGITTANSGRYAVIKGATISDGKIVVGDENVALYDRFGWTAPEDLTKTYDIYGVTSMYASSNNGTPYAQFLPLRVEEVQAAPGEPEYYVAGNFTDPQWADGMVKMTKQTDGSYKLTKDIDDIDGGILFKIIKVVNGTATWLGGETAEGENSHGLNSGWHTDIPLVDGSNFHMTDGGNITFTVNITDNGETLTVDKEKALFIRGTFNEWAKQAMTDANGWTYEAAFDANTAFKFYDEWGIWYGGNGTAPVLGEEYTLVGGDNGQNIVLADANTYTLTVDANVTTLVVEGPFVAATTFKKVTSANELVAGKQYIIVGENTADDVTTTYAINNKVNTNNRRASAVTAPETISGADYIEITDGTADEDIAVFVLGGEADAWTFYDGRQKNYLQSSNGSNNYLYTKAFTEEHAEATITFDENGTTILFNAGARNKMRFNYNGGNPLVSCYASEGTTGVPVTLWVEAVKPEAPTTYTITIAESENGEVTADKAEAAEGETVTLTIKPDEGYELDQLSVMCDNDAVNVTENNTFVMPAGDVTVTATFKAIDFNLTINPAGGTYYKVISAAISAENMPEYASLVYVLNDGEPTTYTSPITINSNSTLIARVIGSTGNMLAEKTVEYTILIPTISVTPGPGTYVDNVVLTVDVTNMPDDGVIKYTLWDPEEEDFIESNVVYDDTEGIVIDQTAVLFVYLLQGNETLAYWGDEWLEDDDFQYTIIAGGTLEDVLAGDDVDAINEDLHIGFKCADDGMVYAADAEGNWIGLHMNDQALAEVLASQNNVLKAGTVKGAAANLTTNPTYNVTSVPELIEGDAAEPVAVNMAANFSDVKGNTLVKISAYYKGEYFSAFQSDYEGQMLTIDNTYMNTDNLVVKQRYNVTGVLRLKGEWEAGSHPAPRKVGIEDSNYHDNMLIMPTSADIVTGVDDINVSSAVGVKYYNVAGVASDKPFDGMNIVVTRNADGTSTVTKVVF